MINMNMIKSKNWSLTAILVLINPANIQVQYFNFYCYCCCCCCCCFCCFCFHHYCCCLLFLSWRFFKCLFLTTTNFSMKFHTLRGFLEPRRISLKKKLKEKKHYLRFTGYLEKNDYCKYVVGTFPKTIKAYTKYWKILIKHSFKNKYFKFFQYTCFN